MGEGLNRARAAARATQTDRKPSKPWRVTGPDGSTDYGGQQKAYREGVGPIVTAGGTAQVLHWEDGRWRSYDRVEPGDWFGGIDPPAGEAG